MTARKGKEDRYLIVFPLARGGFPNSNCKRAGYCRRFLFSHHVRERGVSAGGVKVGEHPQLFPV